VRAVLALSLFLIATTATPTANDPSNNSKARKSLLLLEAIQHFTTAAIYYNYSIHKDIDGDVNLITCSDDIEVLLIPEVSADVNTSSDDDSAANALGTKAEVVEISNETVLKRDQLNESMSLLPPTDPQRFC
jgi:hypothetical protein